MKYYIYILYSSKIDHYYIGYCSDLTQRLLRHNSGSTTYTKRGIPWVMVYSEFYEEKTDAIKRERELKRMKSRNYIESLLDQ